MRTIVFILIVFCCSSFELSAQDIRKDASADLVRIRQAYNRLSAFSMNIIYKFYPSNDADVPVEKHTGYYCKQGADNSYMELYRTLTVTNKEVAMVKDDSSMLFMVKKHYPDDSPQLTHDQFEKLLAVCSSVEKIKGKNDASGYRMVFKGNMNGMSKIEFLFGATSFLITKIVMYYDRPVMKNYQTDTELDYPKPKLEVEYVNVKINPVFDKKKFSVAKYLKKENNAWHLTSAYASSYEFYDQTQVTLK